MHRVFHPIAWAVNIVIAILTICSAYGGAINPQTTVLPALVAMTFPLWIILTGIMFFVDLWLFRRMWPVPLIAFLACLGPLLRYAPMNLSAPPDVQKEKTFTVMSYNVFDLRNCAGEQADSLLGADAVNATLSQIIADNADIVLLQEMTYLREDAARHITMAQVDTIVTRYPHRTAIEGECIYSKFELYPVELRQDSSTYCAFAGAMVNIDGRKTLVISAHFESIGLMPDDKAIYRELTRGEVNRDVLTAAKTHLLSKLARAFRNRARQAALLREQIDSLGVYNLIVGGDFNDIPDCYALRTVCQNDIHNAFADAGGWPMITYHASRFYFHIDHILYRGPLRAIAFSRGSCKRSDHYPILATFEWHQ